MVKISENPEEHSALQTSGNLKFLEYCCGQWEGVKKIENHHSRSDLPNITLKD